MSEREQWARMLEGHPPEIVRSVVEAAPRRAYVTWLITQVRAGEIRLPEQQAEVHSVLTGWERVKTRARFDGRRDINLHSYHQLQSFVQEEIARFSGRQRKAKVKREGAKEAYCEGSYRVLEVTTPDAAVLYSRGTRWCTSDASQASAYLKFGPLYVVLKDGRHHAQFHPATLELRDAADVPPKDDGELTGVLARMAGLEEKLLSARQTSQPLGSGWLERLTLELWASELASYLWGGKARDAEDYLRVACGRRPDLYRVIAVASRLVAEGNLGLACRLGRHRWLPLQALQGLRQGVKMCYAARDFEALCELLRNWQWMDLTRFPLGYMDSESLAQLWEIFKVDRESWQWISRARPSGAANLRSTDWWQFVAFLSELRRKRADG